MNGGEEFRPELERLLECWLPGDLDSPEELEERTALWFGGASAFDDRLRREFPDLPDRISASDPPAWTLEPRLMAAAVIALDQIPRNIHRDSPRAFAYDAAAVAAAEAIVDTGTDRSLHPVLASFVYLPFEHAESLALQERSVACHRRLLEGGPPALRGRLELALDYAERHRLVIERFGRFPHRNRVLGRDSTPEEIAYLRDGGEVFS